MPCGTSATRAFAHALGSDERQRLADRRARSCASRAASRAAPATAATARRAAGCACRGRSSTFCRAGSSPTSAGRLERAREAVARARRRPAPLHAHAVDRDRAGLGPDAAADEVDERALARSVRADQPVDRARAHAEVDAVEDRRAGRVAVDDVAAGDRSSPVATAGCAVLEPGARRRLDIGRRDRHVRLVHGGRRRRRTDRARLRPAAAAAARPTAARRRSPPGRARSRPRRACRTAPPARTG